MFNKYFMIAALSALSLGSSAFAFQHAYCVTKAGTYEFVSFVDNKPFVSNFGLKFSKDGNFYAGSEYIGSFDFSYVTNDDQAIYKGHPGVTPATSTVTLSSRLGQRDTYFSPKWFKIGNQPTVFCSSSNSGR